MTNELHAHSTSGLTLYAVLLDSTGQAWNGATFETLAGANWATYALSLTEAAGGVYLATMPSVGLGNYSYAVYEQAGVSAAVTDALRGVGELAWDGSAVCGPVTMQVIRDALKLAPSAGAPVAGSVDQHLDDILEHTGTTLPGTLATIQTKTDLITTGTALSVVSPLDGDALTIIRGDTLVAAFSGLGDIATRAKLWFTLKRKASDLDAEAILQVMETTGLVAANGAAPSSAALGSLVVTNQVTGAATLTIDETVTDDLAVRAGMVWDIQMLTAGGVVRTLAGGSGAVAADVTRAVA